MVEVVVCTWSFWSQTGSIFGLGSPRDPNIKVGVTREAICNKLTWMFTVFILGYVGAEGLFIAATYFS
jgi:hypothetical protein